MSAENIIYLAFANKSGKSTDFTPNILLDFLKNVIQLDASKVTKEVLQEKI